MVRPHGVLRMQLHTPTKADVKKLPKKHLTASWSPNRIIYCYSKKAPHDGFDIEKNGGGHAGEVWSETLMNTRGLGFNEKGEVIVRGFPKFFNLGENQLSQWDPKYDGDEYSLILVQKFNGFLSHIWPDETKQWPKDAKRRPFLELSDKTRMPIRVPGLRFTTKGGQYTEFEAYAEELYCGDPHEEGHTAYLYGWPQPHREPDEARVILAECVHPEDPHTIPHDPGLYRIGTICGRNFDRLEVDLDLFPGEVHMVHSLAEAQELQEAAEHEGYVLYITRGHEIERIYKLKAPGYWAKRMRRKLLESGARNPDLYQITFTNEGKNLMIQFLPGAAMEFMGDLYDDWIAQNRTLIDTLLQKAREDVLWAWNHMVTSDRKTLATHILGGERPDLLPLVMALYDRNHDKVDRVLNGGWLKKQLATTPRNPSPAPPPAATP